MSEEINNWLKQAEYDLDGAEKNIEIRQYYISAFLSQQAAEKALKAYYLQERKELLKTHNVSRLAQDLNLPEELLKRLSILEMVYQETRYPDLASKVPAEDFDDKDAANLYNVAEEILRWIKERIK